MSGSFSQNTSHILKDLAYIVNFGHFPADSQPPQDTDIKPSHGEEDIKPSATTVIQDEENTEDEQSVQVENSGTKAEEALPQEHKSAATASVDVTCDPVQEHIKEAFNILQKDFDSIEEDVEHNQVENNGTKADVAQSQSHTVAPKAACDVTREHVQELIQEAFVINQQDFNSIKEDVANNKDAPVVELVLDNLEGDALSTATLYFIRALLNSHQTFTKLYRPPITNSPPLITTSAQWEQILTIPIENIYNESVTLEVW
ncbi:unnamed protein product [Meganyctiphanes norvegica]|uniref:Uncharacterized protein n=1 Tax=Meganyctiphanes norvegica TaxID=48144 RepID=A0AAV2RAS0_MEGNR